MVQAILILVSHTTLLVAEHKLLAPVEQFFEGPCIAFAVALCYMCSVHILAV
jgi:hypothetical protein